MGESSSRRKSTQYLALPPISEACSKDQYTRTRTKKISTSSKDSIYLPDICSPLPSEKKEIHIAQKSESMWCYVFDCLKLPTISNQVSAFQALSKQTELLEEELKRGYTTTQSDKELAKVHWSLIRNSFSSQAHSTNNLEFSVNDGVPEKACKGGQSY